MFLPPCAMHKEVFHWSHNNKPLYWPILTSPNHFESSDWDPVACRVYSLSWWANTSKNNTGIYVIVAWADKESWVLFAYAPTFLALSWEGTTMWSKLLFVMLNYLTNNLFGLPLKVSIVVLMLVAHKLLLIENIVLTKLAFTR